MLNEQLQKEINQEANDYANTEVCDWGKIQGNNQLDKWEIAHDAYRDTAMKYAKKWQEAQQRAERYEKALKFILKWEFPPTGQFWDVDKLQPMSYAACYGSNGERDFMRNIANEALTPKTGSDE